MDYPNEPLPDRQLSLLETVKLHRRAVEIWNEMGNNATVDDRSQCINTILCGRWPDPELRMSLNARQGALVPDLADCTVTRDYDSIIGLTDDLPYTIPLSIYPIPSFKFCITRPVHIWATVFTQPVCSIPLFEVAQSHLASYWSGCIGQGPPPPRSNGVYCHNLEKASASSSSPCPL